METIKLYRYQGSLHCDRGLFPPYDKRTTEWSPSKAHQAELYNSATLEHFRFGFGDLNNYIYFNKYEADKPKEIYFIFCELHMIEVPLADWKKAVATDDYEMLPYLVNFDFNIIAERGISLHNKSMNKKTFEEIVYANAVTEGSGIYKPEKVNYGKL